MRRYAAAGPPAGGQANGLTDDELLRLLARGLSITEIARQRGMDRSALARTLRRLAGLHARSTEPDTAEEHAPQASGRALSMVAYTDGASRGNPGESGIAVVLMKDGQVLAEQGRTADDPVKLAPARGTRWDHVVKAYDALWEVELRNIIFALAE